MKKELSFRQKVNQAERNCMVQDILSVVPESLRSLAEKGLQKVSKKKVESIWNEVYITNRSYNDVTH